MLKQIKNIFKSISNANETVTGQDFDNSTMCIVNSKKAITQLHKYLEASRTQ